jgi:hypothetical protein
MTGIGLGGVDLRPLDRDRGQRGLLIPDFPALGGFSSTASFTDFETSRRYAARFVPSRDMTIATMKIAITVVEGSSGNSALDLGIFSADGQTLLGSSGNATGMTNALGWRTATLASPVDLEAGVAYYAAVATPAAFAGTVPRFWGVVPGTYASSAFGATLPYIETAVQLAAAPLVAPYSPSGSASRFPALALLEA